MTLRSKLLGSFAIILATALASGVFSLITTTRLSDIAELRLSRSARASEQVDRLNSATWEMRFCQRGVLFYAMAGEPAESASQVKIHHLAADRASAAAAQLEAMLESQDDRRRLQRYMEALRGYKQAFPEILADRDCGAFPAAADALRQRVRPYATAMVKASDELQDSERSAIDQALNEIRATKVHLRWIQMAIICGLMALGAIVWSTVRRLVVRLKEVSQRVSTGSRAIAGAAGQVSASTSVLVQNASREVSFLTDTSASIEQIAAITHRNSKNSVSAAGLMVEVDRAVSESNQSLDLMVASMREINSSSEQIARIIKVIDGIAFQTNILALNAAVEAARAGETGMGFAVVAGEVRNLAQRSAQAAQETSELIEESIGRSNQGRTRLDDVARASRKITESTANVKNLVDEVSLGSNEQTSGIDTIAQAIQQLHELSESTAAGAVEGAASSDQLDAQAKTLAEAVGFLSGIIGDR